MSAPITLSAHELGLDPAVYLGGDIVFLDEHGCSISGTLMQAQAGVTKYQDVMLCWRPTGTCRNEHRMLVVPPNVTIEWTALP